MESTSHKRMLKFLTWTGILILVLSPDHVTSQSVDLTSTISTGDVVCPGEEIIFTCEATGSSIIAWTSSGYIRNQVQFNAANPINETHQDSVDPNTIATFINNTRDENGIRVLVSQLRIIVSSVSLTPSVTCMDIINNIEDTFPFQVLDVPNEPQVTARYAMDSCALNITWTAPNNIAISDITHFMIYIDGRNVSNKNNSNDTSLSLSYQVSSCVSRNVSVSAINRCDREGPLSSVITVSPESFCDSVCSVNDGPGVNNVPAIVGGVLGAAVGAVLVGVLVVIIVLKMKINNKTVPEETQKGS